MLPSSTALTTESWLQFVKVHRQTDRQTDRPAVWSTVGLRRRQGPNSSSIALRTSCSRHASSALNRSHSWTGGSVSILLQQNIQQVNALPASSNDTFNGHLPFCILHQGPQRVFQETSGTRYGMVWYSRVWRPTRHSTGHFGDGGP